MSYATNRTVAFWQLVNEAETPGCPGGGAAALRAFAGGMRTALRSVDPNHIVSLGTIGSGQCGAAGAEYTSIHEVVDNCEVHDYNSPAVAMPGDAFNGMALRLQQCDDLGKPIFVGEVGIVADTGDVGQSTGTIDATTLQRRAQFLQAKINAQFGAGMDGYLPWDMIVENSSSAFSLNNGRYGIGPFGVGSTEDPALAVMRAAGPRPSPRINAGPLGATNDPTPTFTFSSSVASPVFECRVGTAAAPGTFAACGSPFESAALADGSYLFEVRNAAVAADPTPASRSFVLTGGGTPPPPPSPPPPPTPPGTTIDSGPDAPTGDATPTFTFSANLAGATFECRVGTVAAPGTFAGCASPFTAPAQPDGARRFEVRASTAAGGTDATPAVRTFTVDTTPPQTAIESGPSGATGDTTPQFTFSATEAGVTFACRLGTTAAPGSFGACSSPYVSGMLADGAYTFEVRAADAVGNADLTPAQRAFSIQTPTAPPPPPPPPPVVVLPPVEPPPPIDGPLVTIPLFPPNIGSGTPGTVRASVNGRVRLPRPKVACPAIAPPCSVTLEARLTARGRARIGRTTLTLAPGARTAVFFDLSRSGRAKLARAGRLKATVAVTAAHGTLTRTKTVPITVRPRR